MILVRIFDYMTVFALVSHSLRHCQSVIVTQFKALRPITSALRLIVRTLRAPTIWDQNKKNILMSLWLKTEISCRRIALLSYIISSSLYLWTNNKIFRVKFNLLFATYLPKTSVSNSGIGLNSSSKVICFKHHPWQILNIKT